MAKFFKWFFGILMTLAIVLVIGVIALMSFFNSDSFKDDLTVAVEERTGSKLVIEQELALNFFPWLSIETGGMTLAQPQGFDLEQPVLSVDSLKASVKLMPLFSGDVEIGDIAMDGVALNLIRDRKGRSNLDVLLNNATTERATPTSSETSAEKSSSTQKTASKNSALSINSLSLTNVVVSQFDPKARLTQKFTLQDLAIDGLTPNTFTPISASGSAWLGKDIPNAQWDLDTQFKVSSDFKTINLSDLSVEIVELGELIERLNLDGDLSLQQNLDNSVVAFDGRAVLNGQSVQAKVDGTFTTFKDLVISLHAPTLDLTAWLPAAGAVKETNSGVEVAVDLSPVANFLKRARVKADVSIGQLNYNQISLSQVETHVFNKGATLWLKPLKAQGFQGDLATEASVDFSKNPVRLSVHPTLQKIQIADLLSVFLGYEGLSGLGELDLNLATQGLTPKIMLKNLTGHGNIELTAGEIAGMDLEKVIETGLSLALLDKKQFAGVTKFTGLKGTMKADKGLIELNDVILDTPVFDLSGQMSTDANKESLRGYFQLVLKGHLKTQLEEKYPQLAGKRLPFEIKGTWDEPKPMLDVETLLKDQFQEQIDDKKKELEDKVIDTLEDKLNDRLGDLFKKKKK